MTRAEEIEDLTIRLVKISSINSTKGEAIVAEEIYSYLSNIQYFKENPENLWFGHLENDKLKRKNVFAFLEGKKDKNNKTIILHGHMDTVGVEDFGNLKEYAFNPLELKERLKEIDLPEEIKKDVYSDDWLFGRGACDMKSGVAVHMVILKELSKKVNEFSGNILFMSNPVEENQHTGIMESIKDLKKMKEQKKLEYVVAINNDYITDMFPNDTNKYIYTGSVGKLLPCFYVTGKETHVGQCFEGLNPNIIVSELIKQIDMNTDLCDEYNGEYTLPPTSLKMTDMKDFYNVQTPFSSYVYFNYYIHNASTEKILELLKDKAIVSMENSINYINKQYEEYCRNTKESFSTIKWDYKILTYEELYKIVKEQYKDDLEQIISNLSKELIEKSEDPRIISLKIVEKLKHLSKDKSPSIIIYFAPPYCPHNTLRNFIEEEKTLSMKLKDIIQEFSKENEYTFKVMNFFPSLSDSSYLKIDDNIDSIEHLINNFPNWEELYNVPLKEIKEINIPAINFGCYGKDAHKWTERVYKPYSFETLPQLILKALNDLL